MTLIIRQVGLEDYLDQTGGMWLKALILGENGAGKTPTAATWPKPLIAMCENGAASIAGTGVAVGQISSIADMEGILQIARREAAKPVDQRKYETLVVDTIDSYQKIVMADRLKAERRDQLSMQDWGYVGVKIDWLIDQLMNLPMHVVVLLHVVDDHDRDGDDNVLVKKAALKGQAADSIFHPFDLIGLLEKSYVAEGGQRVEKRTLRWRSNTRYPKLRSRFPTVPELTDVDFTAADFQRVFDAIAMGADPIPDSAVLEEVQTEADQGVAPADLKGGPVDNPTLPKAPAAKKAAAKRTTKKAAPKPEPTPDPEPEPEPATKPEAPTDVPTNEVEAAEQLLKSELGAEEVAETAPEPEPEPTPEPEPAPEPKSEKSVAHCGDAKPGMTATVKGCGVELVAANSTKLAIGRLRTKTELCNQCVDAHKRGELELIDA